MSTQTAEQFLMGSGIPAGKFDSHGDVISGTITMAPEVKQQTDMDTGEPKTWNNGDPMMQLIVTVQTGLGTGPDDNGERRIYVKGKSLTDAVREAVRKTGAKGLQIGGTLAVTYTGDGEAKKRGFNPPKLYAADYTLPDTTAQSGNFLGVTQPPASTTAPVASVAPVASAPSADQIAAVKAAGLNPAAVFPGYIDPSQPPF